MYQKAPASMACYHALVAAAAGDDDDGDVLNFVVQLTQQLEPVHPGQFDINQHHAGSEFRELGERFFAACHAQDLAIPFAKVELRNPLRALSSSSTISMRCRIDFLVASFSRA